MHQGLPWGESPIDMTEEEPGEVKFLDTGAQAGLDPAMGALERMAAWRVPGIRAGLGWAFGAMVVNTLALLALNSHALANWADQLPVTALTGPVVAAADAWHARAGQLGLNTVVDHVEAGAKAMRKAPWPQSDPQQIRP